MHTCIYTYILTDLWYATEGTEKKKKKGPGAQHMQAQITGGIYFHTYYCS